jgi:glyoxylase-like metal-dependent hydrolase (beta-lactamase superfamily II)
VTAAAPITTVVNTHGNGDHWFGNRLLAGTGTGTSTSTDTNMGTDTGVEIIAARASLADMHAVGPAQMLALLAHPGPAGSFAREIFGSFDFAPIQPAYPTTVFDGEFAVDVGGVEVRLLDLGPAHTAGDTVVHVPQASVVYTGDLVFAGGTPVVWHGPFAGWMAACDRILALGAATVVPGHGPVTDAREVRRTRDYLEYVYEQASLRYAAGVPVEAAAREIPLGGFARLGESERLAVNVHAVYREHDPRLPPLDGPGLFGCMAETAHHFAIL